jgi:hypothetical protein
MASAADIGLRDEIESAVCSVRNSYRELQHETRDHMRRIALLHTNAQARESLVSLWIERAQREARHA